MLTVLSVYWEGDFRNRKYTPDWVRKHQAMCLRVLPEAQYKCLSNVEIDGVETIPLETDWSGWWAKVELFRPSLPVEGRLLYLDLDCILVGNMQSLLATEAPITFCPPSYTFTGGAPSTAKGICDKVNSSVILWTKGECSKLYELFEATFMQTFRGDQDWFGYVMPDLPTFSPTLFQKLKKCTRGPKSGTEVVLCMPWKNEEASNYFPWVKEIWNA